MNTTAISPEESFRVHDILRTMASSLEVPGIIILIAMALAAVALLGWLIGEGITERRHLKLKLPELLDNIRESEKPLKEIINESGLLKSQKQALSELCSHPRFNDVMLEALAVRILEEEQSRYDRILKYSELIARLGPMFGLLCTLIPLGPGIIALGQGDTYTLSVSLLTAFDTTTVGLVAAAIATVISTIRRSWYRDYMSILEVIANCVLEILKEQKNDLEMVSE